jgi:hypothetical protein
MQKITDLQQNMANGKKTGELKRKWLAYVLICCPHNLIPYCAS